ncbi:alpha-D-ribose 1-methylphosphonate 5-triphosphate synthase subunit PhnH [Gracilibacillus ureilyticus]|uniref:Alpha-D-ribose 1-methylphosphonate 5-triphosphate synthase subunit PhnH n=2 Tax=Gracilibacillus ureilyticus TaxID=531814 RepID=A0A1H9MQN3_9BACI|nr:alpha-D-ribose 1-methylphosphonate 5-triphosphate synthase subunit PhnH [Gracilibacillus ureilyticus]
MVIDQVHDLQKVYRKILHSMSRPGTITSFEQKADSISKSLPCNEAVFLCALTLFDAEVTFHIIGEQEKSERLAELISSYTMSNKAPHDQADFIIALQGNLTKEIEKAMNVCKSGDLINPQNSATWILESVLISNQSGVTLTGPGIEREALLQTGYDEHFWMARNLRTKEYPLGIDCIFADFSNQIACVPRTTKMVATEVI